MSLVARISLRAADPNTKATWIRSLSDASASRKTSMSPAVFANSPRSSGKIGASRFAWK
jgi:hypothetical protein